MCMRVLPNIELTEEQYEYIICRDHYFGEGVEADIYKMSKKNVAKIWYTEYPDEIENKFQKLNFEI